MKLLAVIAPLLLCLLGLGAMISWHLPYDPMLQLHRDWAPSDAAGSLLILLVCVTGLSLFLLQQKRLYDHYVNCYITKPVDLNQFMKVVKGIDDFWFSIVRLPKE